MDTTKPRISIIIPVYNGGNYLKEAIDSAVFQDYENFEVLVVNDGSTDNGRTEAISLSYGKKIRYLSKTNGGVATALNFGIKNATGSYISWLSHDDVYLHNKLSKQVRFLEKEKPLEKIILSTDIEIIDNSGIKTNTLSLCYEEENFIYELLMRGIINGCTLLIPRSAFFEVGEFDETLKTTQDYHLWFKFAKAGYKFHHMSEILVKSRMHSEQDSVKKTYLAKRERKDLEKFVFSLFSPEDFTKGSKCRCNPTMLVWKMKIILFVKQFIPAISIGLKKLGVYDFFASIYLKYVLKK